MKSGRATSKAKKAKRGGATAPPSAHALLTVSHPALLDGDSDRRFRQFVSDLLTLSVRMEQVRDYLGRQMGISGPQYSLLVAISHRQGKAGVSVGALARGLHVSSAFIATETRKLVQAGLIVKLQNPEDRRGVLVSLSASGEGQIARLTPEIRAINDHFFGSLNRADFDAMASASAALVKSSARALARVHLSEVDASFGRLEAAE